MSEDANTLATTDPTPAPLTPEQLGDRQLREAAAISLDMTLEEYDAYLVSRAAKAQRSASARRPGKPPKVQPSKSQPVKPPPTSKRR